MRMMRLKLNSMRKRVDQVVRIQMKRTKIKDKIQLEIDDYIIKIYIHIKRNIAIIFSIC